MRETIWFTHVKGGWCIHEFMTADVQTDEKLKSKTRRINANNTISVKVSKTRSSYLTNQDIQLWRQHWQHWRSWGRWRTCTSPRSPSPKGMDPATANLLKIQMTMMQTPMATQLAQMEKQLVYKTRQQLLLTRELGQVPLWWLGTCV